MRTSRHRRATALLRLHTFQGLIVFLQICTFSTAALLLRTGGGHAEHGQGMATPSRFALKNALPPSAQFRGSA